MNNVTYRRTARAGDADPKHLSVFLNGAQEDSKTRPGKVITNTLARYGDVWAVDYPEGPFRSRRVIDVVTDTIVNALVTRYYRRVTFIGLSM